MSLNVVPLLEASPVLIVGLPLAVKVIAVELVEVPRIVVFAADEVNARLLRGIEGMFSVNVALLFELPTILEAAGAGRQRAAEVQLRVDRRGAYRGVFQYGVLMCRKTTSHWR